MQTFWMLDIEQIIVGITPMIGGHIKNKQYNNNKLVKKYKLIKF